MPSDARTPGLLPVYLRIERRSPEIALTAGVSMLSADKKETTIAVMGAGSVGCYFGGMLARAGHSVTLIGRPSHVDAIQAQGLLLETLNFTERVKLHASTSVGDIADAQIILFCVKSTDTETAAREMLPHLSPDAIVLSLQNGVENAEMLQRILPQRVIPAVVYVATEMAGPGHLKHHGRGELVIGDSPVSQQIAAMSTAAGVPVQVSTNIVGILWGKLIVNCAYNALSAIAQKPYGKLVEGDGVRELMHTIVTECLAVAKAIGVQVPGDSYETVRLVSTNMATQYSSTAQDVARGKPNEIDYLNGYVCRQGVLSGVPTPVNQTLLTLVKLISTQ